MAITTDHSMDKQALLEHLLRNRLGQVTPAASGIPQRTHDGPMPLSFVQQHFWLLSLMYPESLIYHRYGCVHMSGPLHIDALEQSLGELLRRHEAWRTSFPVIDGETVQVIHPPTPFRLPVIDLSHLPPAERAAEVRRPRQDLLQVFDLTQAPPLRAQLVRLDAEEHCLCLMLHHIIFDASSLSDIFLSELYTLYQAFSAGLPSSLPELPIQYADYALWQHQTLDEKTLAGHLDYWKQQLAEAPTALDLPADHIRPPGPLSRGSTCALSLPAHLRDTFLALAQEEKGTLFMALQAAFAVLLARYSGQEDIVLGIPFTGRKYQEVQGLLGSFPNTLPLRTNLSGNPSFRELLRRVRKTTLEALDHDELPFEHLVKFLHPKHAPGQNPLFQVMLNFEQHSGARSTPGWTFDPEEFLLDTAMADLSLYLEDRPDGLRGYFEYSTDLFEPPTIERMIGHWQKLLESIAADPDQSIASLPLLLQTERQQMLVEWNATQAPYPKNQCVHRLFEQQVERSPDAVAVVYQGATLTYGELNERANQLAHFLRKLGIGPDVLVGLCVERSLDMIVGMLGILKAGGAYVPMDPAYPRDRLAFMLEDSQASVLVTQQALQSLFPQHSTPIVCLDTDREKIAQESSANPVTGVQAEHLVYVIYTSGSTGKPKGVLVPHQGLVNHNIAYITQFGLQPTDRALQFASISFDTAGEEIYPILLSGAALVLRPAGPILTPAELLRLTEQERLTVFNLPTAYWHTWVEYIVDTNTRLPESLRLVVIGGEAALPHYLTLWQQHIDPWVRWCNSYGPTEVSITSATYDLLEPGEAKEVTTVPIGRPIANIQAYVLDKNLQPVPIGILGELYLGGDGLAHGYLNRPELTAERFIKHPFSTQADARLYKTGDLARWRPDGNLEYIGRIDHQVKIRGFRIELGEIEAVLNQHAAVHQAVVMAREDIPGDKRLVAYVVPHPTHDIDANDLHNFLRTSLPEYMIPTASLVLEAFPMTPNGKVDRRALPAPEMTRRTAEETFVAPTLRIHDQLISIWEELLTERPIGIRDNFFDLGGHSLLAARMSNRIEQVFGKKLPFVTFFAEPTIEHLANTLLEEGDTSSRVRLGKEEGDSRAPVVAVQAGGSRRPFFFLHGQDESYSYYCFPLARALGSEQPFYALERYRIDGLVVPPTLEAMAAAHLKSMRAVQPEGPYLLGGWCNGGLLAYEMARQLHAAGQAVDLLVLMDPTPPVPQVRLRVLRGFVKRCGALAGLGQDKQLDWFLRLRRFYLYGDFSLRHAYSYARQLKDSRPLAYLGGKQSTKSPVESTEQREPEYRFLEIDFGDYLGTYGWVMPDYKPTDLYPGKITFFWTSKQPARDKWRRMEEVSEVEAYILPGAHMDTLTNHLDALADRLNTCLSKAQAPHSAEEHEPHPIIPDRAFVSDPIQGSVIPVLQADQIAD